MIKSIKIKNLLSYGPKTDVLPLTSLNVLIGPNGSGKSNLLETIGLMRSTPINFSNPIKGIGGGGIQEWLWKGNETPASAEVDFAFSLKHNSQELHHSIKFAEHSQHMEIEDENIYSIQDNGQKTLYTYREGKPVISCRQNGSGEVHDREIPQGTLEMDQSILAQRKDPDQYPELHVISEFYRQIRIYTNWGFGRKSPQRLPQPADGRIDFLTEDSDNLGLVLNSLRSKPKAKMRILQAMEQLYEGITDFDVSIVANTVQIFLVEGMNVIPSTRLSDGTMRYLSLLTILCHPTPPPLICIEEPELGLHPDVMPEISGLLKEAATRCQLIVTTHSPALVDALTSDPESIIVSERHKQSTCLRRLKGEDLEGWLKDYSLGKLWRMGELGGNRW